MLFPSKISDYEYDCVKDSKIDKIKLSDIKSKYIVLAFYPLDFTFVCPTEIIKLSEMHSEFTKLDTTVVFSSCDSVYSHLEWNSKGKESGGLGGVKWPIISDISHKLCEQFGLYNQETGTTMRSTVILNRDLKVLHMSANIDPIGRSSSEIIRLIKAFDFNEKNGEVCFVDFDGN